MLSIDVCQPWLIGSKHIKDSKERYLLGQTQHANFRGNPFFHSYKPTLKQQLNSEKWDVELKQLSAFGWLGFIGVALNVSRFLSHETLNGEKWDVELEYLSPFGLISVYRCCTELFHAFSFEYRCNAHETAKRWKMRCRTRMRICFRLTGFIGVALNCFTISRSTVDVLLMRPEVSLVKTRSFVFVCFFKPFLKLCNQCRGS